MSRLENASVLVLRALASIWATFLLSFQRHQQALSDFWHILTPSASCFILSVPIAAMLPVAHQN